QQQQSIPEHHHIQYPSYKDTPNTYSSSNGISNGNGASNGIMIKTNGSGMARSHTHSMSHSHLHFAPYQEQNQKQQYQQPQQQHFNGFHAHQQQHQSPFRHPGSSGFSHSISMPMKPPTPTRMHLQFGPGAPSYDRRGSFGGIGYHDGDTAMDSDGSSNGDSGDEGVIQGAQWTRQE
ncbi:hypothetical protein BGX29_001514, partial [Mortierella sp. GBA35]